MLVKIALLFIAIILFSGCVEDPQPPEVKIIEKKVYIKSKERVLINLPHIDIYDLSGSMADYNLTHKLVVDADLQRASKICVKRASNILFYERQNRGVR